MEETLDPQTRNAVDRTRLAHDRTLMAWIRTSTSLISFGFSIYKGFDLLDPQHVQGSGLIGPRGFAQIMIAIGVASLAVATVDHMRNLSVLRAQYGPHLIPRSYATVVASAIAALGVLGFLAAWFRQ